MRFLLMVFMIVAIQPATTQAKNLRIVTDIAPVTALVRAVSAGIQQPFQIIARHIPAHDFALRPSDASNLRQADLVVWMGPIATPGFAHFLEAASFNDRQLTLGDGGVHAWLSPKIAVEWATSIAIKLAALDPENATVYSQNAEALTGKIQSTVEVIRAMDLAQKARPYIQFHDAFTAFETTFGIAPLGVVTRSDDEAVSLGVIADLAGEISEQESVCIIFTSDLQRPKAVGLMRGQANHSVTISPFGLGLEDNFTYPDFLLDVAAKFSECLKK